MVFKVFKFIRWDDITNLLNQKRMFGIECQRSEENVNFYFDDPEAARYVWKLAVLQVGLTAYYAMKICYSNCGFSAS